MPTGFTRERIKVILLRTAVLLEDGQTLDQIALVLECTAKQLRHWMAQEDDIFSVPGPWQLEHKGKRWTDMPGTDPFSKRCMFSLFRRGKFDPDQRLAFQPFKRRGRPKKTEEPEIDVAPTPPDIAW